MVGCTASTMVSTEVLEQKCVLYMSENERELFEVKNTTYLLQFKDSNEVVDTRRWGCVDMAGRDEFWEWSLDLCFVDTLRTLCSPKIKGRLHHSSFLAGEDHGSWEYCCKKSRPFSISPTSGHYKPSLVENLIAMDNWLASCGEYQQSRLVWIYTESMQVMPFNLCLVTCTSRGKNYSTI